MIFYVGNLVRGKFSLEINFLFHSCLFPDRNVSMKFGPGYLTLSAILMEAVIFVFQLVYQLRQLCFIFQCPIFAYF